MNKKDKKIDSDIAIIGMSARLPMSKNLDDFWNKVCEGNNFITTIPENRKKDIEQFYSDKNGVYYYNAAYLDEVDKFDYKFFKISPNEASLIDPNQRIMLEIMYSCIEDAGYSPGKIKNINTGIYIGFTGDYAIRYLDLLRLDTDLKNKNSTLLNTSPFLAARIAHFLNITGPNLVINTACSSSLVALHTACKSIRNGECEQALVASSNVLYNKTRKGELPIESSDLELRPFDKKANGTIWGEGVIALMLKPLSKALRDNDNIYGVVKGSAINHDGTSQGITTPNEKSQTEMMLKAWDDARVNPEKIFYIEAHGTSTTVGDKIELEAIDKAIKKFSNKKQFINLGTIKANLGHLDCASGLAGVLKILLMIKNKQLPPQINVKNPIESLKQKSTLKITDELKSFSFDNSQKIFGINSFGLSGTNCHVVLSELSKEKHANERKGISIFTLSAKTKKSLEKYVVDYLEFFKKDNSIDVDLLCFTANCGREQFQFRLAMPVANVEDLIKKLEIIKNKGLSSYEKEKIFYGEKKRRLDKSNKYNYNLKNLSHRNVQAYNEKVCKYFCDGKDVEWDKIYKSKQYKKVSLPTYPFEKNRCWPIKRGDVSNDHHGQEINKSKLNYRLVENDNNKYCFIVNLDQSEHWIVKEHVINNKYTLAGTAYLEMVTRAFMEILPKEKITLSNILFLRPMIFEKNEKKEIKIIIYKNNNNYKFQIQNISEKENEFVTNVQGEIKIFKPINKKIKISDLLKKLKNKKVNFLYNNGYYKNDFYSERWDNISKHYFGTSQNANVFVNNLILSEKYSHEIDNFYLHPALMDNIARSSFDNDQFVPIGYKDIFIYKKIPQCFFSICREKNKTKKSSYREFDLNLVDYNGELIIQIIGFQLKKTDSFGMLETSDTVEKGDTKDNVIYFKSAWKKIALDKNSINSDTQKVLIFRHANDFGMSKKIIQHHKKDNCTEIIFSNKFKEETKNLININYKEKLEYEKILKFHYPTVIYYLGGIEIESCERISFEKMGNINEISFLPMLYIMQAIDKLQSFNKNLKIKIITNNIFSSNEYLYPYSSTLLGLAKTIVKEYPRVNINSIDFDKNEFKNSKNYQSRAIKTICEYLPVLNGSELSIRKNGLFLREFFSFDLAEQKKAPLKTNGIYWIIGGAGGLGFTMARYLAENYQATIIMSGRLKLNNEINEKIKTINKLGGTGMYIQSDIADEVDSESCYKKIKNKFKKINGVIHSAVSYKPHLMVNLNSKIIEKLFAAKVDGTMILAKIVKNENLDIAVFFSSTYSSIGDNGLACYSAANSFMDNYVKYLNNKTNINPCIFNWGYWGDAGLAANQPKYKKLFDSQGLLPISSQEGVRSFEKILQSGEKQVFAIKAKEIFFQKEGYKYIKNVSNISEIGNRNNIVKTEEHAKKNNKKNYVHNQLSLIWKDVLGYSNINSNDNFYELGGDSISAMQLVAEIDNKFNTTLQINDIFKNPTIEDQTRLVLKFV